MSDIKLNIFIKEENSILFKRCIRKLLDSTFIVGEKDEKLYSFISRESNKQDISDYLRMIGFDVLVDEKVRIAMLKQYESDEELVGLKRTNVLTFSSQQYHILLVLWQIYLENLGFSAENIVSLGDFIEKLKTYKVDVHKRDLSSAMKLFKKYDLIYYDEKDDSEEPMITLYPSLQFGWNLSQFQIVSAEYLKKIQKDSEKDDDTQYDELQEDDVQEDLDESLEYDDNEGSQG